MAINYYFRDRRALSQRLADQEMPKLPATLSREA